MREIYLDNAATTRVYDEVAAFAVRLMCEDYGNPSSLHMKGVTAERYLKEAAQKLAGIMKVDAGEIVFTSGGTESSNLAIIGAAMANKALPFRTRLLQGMAAHKLWGCVKLYYLCVYKFVYGIIYR